MKTNRKYFFVFFLMFISLFEIPMLCYSKTGREIARDSFPSVVMLIMEDSNGQPLSIGSGFFIGEGIIVTNLHVVSGAANGYAKLIGKNEKYKIAGSVGIDTKRDLVLLSVPEATAPKLSASDSKQVAIGDEIYAIGNPQGLEGTFSQGIISSIRKIGTDTLLQITAPISPGSSGGPVINVQGQVIGVAAATFLDGQNLNFAIPISYVTSLLQNRAPVKALSVKKPARGNSILDNTGSKNLDGVIGEHFAWTYQSGAFGDYSFSFRNQLLEPVHDIYCLAIFYDHSGQPLDFDFVTYQDFIPPKLAKRVTSKVDGSVQRISNKVVLRILDFKIYDYTETSK